MKHLHIPLSEHLHNDLMAEARQSGESATSIARHAIEHALQARRRKNRQNEIAAYAAAHAGSELDLDPDLEAATLTVLSEDGSV